MTNVKEIKPDIFAERLRLVAENKDWWDETEDEREFARIAHEREKRLAAAEAEVKRLRKALTNFKDAIDAQHGKAEAYFNEDTWNPEAHQSVTITVNDIREMFAALAATEGNRASADRLHTYVQNEDGSVRQCDP